MSEITNNFLFSPSMGGGRGEAFTVIIPACNAEKHLAAAIESVLKQSFVDFELIVVNDGSTDNTRSIIASYDDKRIRLIDNPEQDRVESLNLGIKAAIGQYM